MTISETQPTTTLKSLIPSEFWLQKNDDYGIYVSNDSNRGIAIQVIMFKEQKKKNMTGDIVSLGKQPNTIWQQIVNTKKSNGSTSTLIAPVEFKKQLAKVVGYAKEVLTQELRSEEMCIGGLQDIYAQVKK